MLEGNFVSVMLSHETGPAGTLIGMVALLMAAFNVVGGFVITDRMLRLFKYKTRTQEATDEGVRNH